MKNLRYAIPGLAFAAAALAATALPARANEAAAWPDRMVNLIVPFPAGSVTDRIGRVLAQSLEKSLGQTVVVENRPGAGATIGSDYVARAEPDGYTLVLGANASHAVNPTFMKLGYDPVKSFEPISLVAVVPSVLMVNPALPIKTLDDLIEQAKARPDGLTYTSAGIGTTGHLGMEMLASMTGMKLVHVPAKGPGRALQDVMAGHVDMLIESVALSAPLVKDGRLRGIAVTSPERSTALPDVPTLDEAGAKDYELALWFALFAPAGTPQAVVDKLQAETAAIFSRPEVSDPFVRDGVLVVAGTSDELRQFQQAEIDKFAKLIEDLDLDLGQ